MRPVRRTMPEVRMEMTPLIDVVFLLLTFFVFSLVLMVRAERLQIRVPDLTRGAPVAQGDRITIGVSDDGTYWLAGAPVALDDLPARVRDALDQHPGAAIAIAADSGARWQHVIAAVEGLRAIGITDLDLIGRPAPDPQ